MKNYKFGRPDDDDNIGIDRKSPVTMVTWNCDDTLVVTSLKTCIIKIWNSKDAQLIHELKVSNRNCIEIYFQQKV